MKVITVLLALLISYLSGLSQAPSKALGNQVKLIRSSSQDCDHTFDPYRLKTRLSDLEYTDSTTIFTVHFSENCCAAFVPQIKFYKNKLVLLPYGKYTGGYCTCNCCFSIRYEVAGLAGKTYKVYFQDREVTLSSNYYDTVKPSFQIYKGRKINRVNKYGFKEGAWISFYENGREKDVSQYPDPSPYFDLPPFWAKGHYPSGNPAYYNREDTSESWFEDGELRTQIIKYKVGDTAYEKGFRKYENRVLKEAYFEKYYPTVFTSEFDADYKDSGWISENVYKKEYFKNGRPKFLFGSDTSYSWFETGQLESKRYKGGTIAFDTSGRVKEQSYSWLQKGSKHSGDLSNTLYVRFYPTGTIQEMHFVRDAPTDGGIAPGNHYYWKWDKNMNLLESPQNWKEPLPWQRFSEIQLPEKMYEELLKTYR